MTESQAQKLTSGKLLIRNAIYSLVGQGIPLLVGIFSIPALIRGFGTERFGILSIAWMMISYFSLFDLGLGRALTQLIAGKLGKGELDKEIAPLIWTACGVMVGLGVVGAALFWILSPWVVYGVLKVSTALREETLHTFYLLSVSVPIITVTAALVGILSAFQRFDVINAIRIPLGLFMFLSPLIVLPFTQSLVPVMAILIAGRMISFGLFLHFCFHTIPSLKQGLTFQKTLLSPLLKFGGWMTLSNIIGPLMVNMDRLLIGGLISVTAVAYYTTPYEIATKLWLIPSAVVSVLFPAFSTSFIHDRTHAIQLFNRGVKYIFLIMFPITLTIVTFAQDGMKLWLGEEFSQQGTPVLQLLAIGVLINSVSQFPFALIQGLGRPDMTAKFHCLELPLYLVLLWQFTSAFGITGTALAWLIRVVLDTVLLFYMANLFLLQSISLLIQRMFFSIGTSSLLLGFAFLNLDITFKIPFLLMTLLAFAFTSWLVILDNQERGSIRAYVKAI